MLKKDLSKTTDRYSGIQILVIAIVLICLSTTSKIMASQEILSPKSKLALVLESFPTADKIESQSPSTEGETILSGNTILGYLLYTDDVYPIPAYSGKPIRAMVTINTKGVIQHVNIISHEEPILVVGLSNEELHTFTKQYSGISINEKVKLGRQKREGYTNLDGISGATITAMVMHQTIMKSAKKVIGNRGDIAILDPETDPIWVTQWETHTWQIAVLLMMIMLLTVLMFLQDWIVIHTRYFHIFRVSFLILTLFYIGYYLKAQLSIINIITFVQILTSGFSWDTLLIDPFVFILWAFVAFSILLWGRGVYCGWLCPFGALQELINKTARLLKIKQLHIPMILHERLWAIKYVVLMLLIGLSLESLLTVIPFIDIEPFKTTFSLHFSRPWYYTLYVITLLAIGVINAKFYCKYICPLGAALSISTRFRIFDWLRRRNECGSPCHSCGNECSVGAIRQTGEIIANECHYCLECQATYWDDHKCPTMVNKRERAERRKRKTVRIPTQQVD